MKRRAWCAMTALVVAGCSPLADPSSESAAPTPTAVQEREAYEGTLPCADCEGIHTLLVLDPESHRYQLVETYRGTREPDSVFRTKGDWSAVRGSGSDSSALVYELDPKRSTGVRHFMRMSENEIRQLDHEQLAIDSRMPYSLYRVPVPEGMAARRPITLADSGRAVRLRPGEHLTVRLPSNRSTGYGWAWVDTASLRLDRVAGPKYEPPVGDRPGAQGNESFTFVLRAGGAGTDTLRLVYSRPWEHGAAPARTFRLRVKAR